MWACHMHGESLTYLSTHHSVIVVYTGQPKVLPCQYWTRITAFSCRDKGGVDNVQAVSFTSSILAR